MKFREKFEKIERTEDSVLTAKSDSYPWQESIDLDEDYPWQDSIDLDETPWQDYIDVSSHEDDKWQTEIDLSVD